MSTSGFVLFRKTIIGYVHTKYFCKNTATFKYVCKRIDKLQLCPSQQLSA